jgi:hypothetical protein
VDFESGSNAIRLLAHQAKESFEQVWLFFSTNQKVIIAALTYPTHLMFFLLGSSGGGYYYPYSVQEVFKFDFANDMVVLAC